MQNQFLRTSLFYDSRTLVNILYNEFRVLKLEDMIDIKLQYISGLEAIHDHSTRQKVKKDVSTHMLELNGVKI